MSEFYATIRGNRGPATRQGSKSSGIHVAAQSWVGSVSIDLYYPCGSKQVCCKIQVGSGSTSHPSGPILYDGPLHELVTGKAKIPV